MLLAVSAVINLAEPRLKSRVSSKGYFFFKASNPVRVQFLDHVACIVWKVLWLCLLVHMGTEYRRNFIEQLPESLQADRLTAVSLYMGL